MTAKIFWQPIKAILKVQAKIKFFKNVYDCQRIVLKNLTTKTLSKKVTRKNIKFTEKKLPIRVPVDSVNPVPVDG